MIVLHQFPRARGIPNPSQFCVKIGTYLRLAKLPYRSEPAIPFEATLGKLPFIVDDGKKICDSRPIVEYLKTTYGDTLDGWLSPEHKWIAMARPAEVAGGTPLLGGHAYPLGLFGVQLAGEPAGDFRLAAACRP